MLQSEIITIVDTLFDNDYINKTIYYEDVIKLLKYKGVKITEDAYNKNSDNGMAKSN
jgi:hypothetical protein